MNERLRIRLGEYLLSEDVKFTKVENVDFDSAMCTIDISYRGLNGGFRFHETPMSDISEFLTFMITGGNE